MIIIFLNALLLGCILLGSCVAKASFAVPTLASTIERSQEILREDEALRQKIGQEEKFFVKTIILKGALRLSEEEIKDVVAPFQGQWMTKGNIQQIIDFLRSAYEKKGIEIGLTNVSYELKKDKTLEITVNELTN